MAETETTTVEQTQEEKPEEKKPEQTEHQKRIGLAFARSDEKYIAETLKSRTAGPDSSGSTFDETQTVQSLIEANWEPYEHPAVLKGCTAFKAPIPGMLGVVDLAQFPSMTMVKLVDPKGTAGTYGGGLMAELPLKLEDQLIVDFSVIILGPEDGKEVVYTFHPGDPIRPTMVDKAKWKNETVNIVQALERGFRYGKVRPVQVYEPSVPVDPPEPAKEVKPTKRLTKTERLREIIRKGKEVAKKKARLAARAK